MKGALEGIRVLDLGWVLSGPYCTMVLCDLGAEVIKIERPGRGDIVRHTAPMWTEQDSGYFMSINRGKKSVTLNLADERGRDIFLSLVKHADVVLENFIPGATKKLRIDYPVLKEVNPRIIYAAISGFGQTGPYAQRPALDVIVQGMGGIMSITGEPGRPPARVGASIGDIFTGVFMATAILAAIYERSKSGEGQMIDMSMMDAQVAMMEHAFTRYFVSGEVPGPLGSRHPSVAPFQAFPTKDGYIVFACIGVEPDPWPLLCSALDLIELIDDPRFATPNTRLQHHAEMEPILNEALKRRTTQEWLDELTELGIPCGPVNTLDKVAVDSQIAQREMIVELPHERIGTWKGINSPISMSRTPGRVWGLAPELSAHTEEILGDILDITPEQVAELREAGVV